MINNKFKRPPFQKQKPLSTLQKVFVGAAIAHSNRSKRTPPSLPTVKFTKKEK
jgi:hypothetical protein